MPNSPASREHKDERAKVIEECVAAVENEAETAFDFHRDRITVVRLDEAIKAIRALED